MAANRLELFEELTQVGPAPTCVGIEQEFEVWRREERIDFRDVIHTLGAPGLRLDPRDVNAYRLENGLALTCDESEAELASPPIPVEPGFACVVASHAAEMRRTLQGLLPEGMSVRGYSTHLSVSVPGPPDTELAERWARTFGPLFGVLSDRAESQGIYVRPRPDRLELCSEFMEGRRLEAAAAFAAGSVVAAREGDWPRTIDLELFPCHERFGFRVHRLSSGFDLYAAGRQGILELTHGGRQSLGKLFEQAATLSTTAIGPYASSSDIHQLRAVAAGVRPLGIEARDEPTQNWGAPPDLGYGLAGQRWQSGSASVVPWRATWEYAMFEVRAAGAPPRCVSVPSVALLPLAALVERDIEKFARTVAAQEAAEFTSYGQTAVPAVFASLPTDPEVLLPEELPVAGAAKARAWPKPARIGKVVPIPRILLRPADPLAPIPLAPFPPATPSSPPATPVAGPEGPTPVPLPSETGGGPPWGIVTIVGAALLGFIAVVGVIVAGSSDPANGSPTPVTSHAVIPSTTLSPTKLPTETPATVKSGETAAPSPAASQTAASLAATAQATSTAVADTPSPTITSTAQPQPSDTPGTTSTPTPHPTETPLPTLTPTPTRPVETQTPMASPTATVCQGAACI